MTSPFEKALEFVLKEEGGFVDDPDDAGGATNFGITQKVYDRYRKENALPLEAVRGIIANEVRDIYFHGYWEKGKCNELPPKMSLIHFDSLVNIRGAVKVLQRTINVFVSPKIAVDGKLGPKTLDAAGATIISSDMSEGRVVDEMIWQRMIYYRRRVDKRPVNIKFLRNWLVRLEHLRKFINE